MSKDLDELESCKALIKYMRKRVLHYDIDRNLICEELLILSDFLDKKTPQFVMGCERVNPAAYANK